MNFYPRLAMLLVTLPVVATVACSAPSDSGEDDSNDSRVVGGQAESGYAPVGYLMKGADAASLAGPNCGVTLIAPHVALTAAHCIVLQPSAKYGIGFGNTDAGVHIAAKRVFAHPAYNVSAPSERFRHDVAVIILESDSTVVPAVIGTAEVGNTARYVGYGRTTPGGYNVYEGYTGERKSTNERVTNVDALDIWTTGDGGGLCWGDSGGPLMRGNEILGVLSDFDQVFDCQVGNKMIFTSLVGETPFIEKAVSCQDSLDPNCLGTVFEATDGGALEAGPARDAGPSPDAGPARDAAVDATDAGLGRD